MDKDKINGVINNFSNPSKKTRTFEDGNEEEVCDLQTGECYVIRSKDGIVERLNKRFITEDGRQLLGD